MKLNPNKSALPEKFLLYVYIFVTVGLLVGAVAFSVLHDKGYRIKGFSIQQTSTLQMDVSEDDAWIFVGEKLLHRTVSEFESIFIPDVDPGTQLITIIKDSYFPWAKHLPIPSNETLRLHPFLLKQDVEASEITRQDPEFSTVISLFRSSQYTPQTSYQTDVHKITATTTGVLIECLDGSCSVPPISLDEPAIAVYQFRSNPNVAIYATPSQIWVSELVADTRIAYQIYEGDNFKMAPQDNLLFIQNNQKYYKIEF